MKMLSTLLVGLLLLSQGCLAKCLVKDINAYESQVLDAYLAYYGRPADPAGLAYWVDVLQGSGGDLSSILAPFANSPEFTRRFGALSHSELITQLYRHLFNREPDAAGKRFYLDALTTGAMSIHTIALDLLSGAQNEDTTLLRNRRSVALDYLAKSTTLSAGLEDTRLGMIFSKVTEDEGALAEACDLTLVDLSGGCRGLVTYREEPERYEWTPNPSEQKDLGNPAKLAIAACVISSFENSTTDLQYGYAENLGDGRGITAGRAGFTSGTGDMLQVVNLYTEWVPENPLAPYRTPLSLIDLQRPEGMSNPSTHGLEDLEAAWGEAAQDDMMKRAQDEVFNTLYLAPALIAADSAGIHTALGQLILLDTIIQHGGGQDVDGLESLIAETNLIADGAENTPSDWLQAFLTIRRNHLENPADPATKEEWGESVDRVEALRSLLDSDNESLNLPMAWEVFGDGYTLTDRQPHSATPE